ncbi:hypothetical protein [Pseudomonas savastanoi]|uniref:hypothetical protein n=1 Tax=Pseudomonas savastanoi TaxID=29438 RepID=UPI001CE38CFB|nr:hypothetical protein [Pseudomonas savastanoi]
MFVGIFKAPMQTLTNWVATGNVGTDASFSNQVNPLIKMQTIGDYTLGVTETLMAAYAGLGCGLIGQQLAVGWGPKYLR